MSPRERILEDARSILRSVHGDEAVAVKVIIVTPDTTVRVVLFGEPVQDDQDAALLSAAEEAILGALRGTACPLLPKQLSKVTGYAYSGSFRNAIKSLISKGSVVQSEDGLCLFEGDEVGQNFGHVQKLSKNLKGTGTSAHTAPR